MIKLPFGYFPTQEQAQCPERLISKTRVKNPFSS